MRRLYSVTQIGTRVAGVPEYRGGEKYLSPVGDLYGLRLAEAGMAVAAATRRSAVCNEDQD